MEASVGKIVQAGFTRMLFGGHVIQLKRQRCTTFRQSAILATEPGPASYSLAQRLLLRRWAHAEFFLSDKRALECMRSTTEPTNL